MIGMRSRQIKRIAVPCGRGRTQKMREEMEYQLDRYKEKNGLQNNDSIFVIMIINHENDYSGVKNILTDMGIMSQCIQRRTAQKLNMSVATNIMKQVNSKVGGESLRVKLPPFVEKSRVMVIGIDVCHAGGNSVVGVVASTNKHFTSFYSDIIIQAKGQEVVKRDLDKFLNKALFDFEKNFNDNPDKIIIFRDGVGDSMREDLVGKEIVQFRETIKQRFDATTTPKITLVVVNKRINQRMFTKQNGEMANPSPGTILDSTLVEN